MLGVSRREYARRHGVFHRAIQVAIAAGTVWLYADGSVDVAASDARWGRRHAAASAPLPRDLEWEAMIDDDLAQAARRGPGRLGAAGDRLTERSPCRPVRARIIHGGTATTWRSPCPHPIKRMSRAGAARGVCHAAWQTSMSL